MSGFFEGGIAPLVSSVLLKDNPLYVQFYVTARCNLRCRQCNVIYANADMEECTTDEAKRIAENLAEIGTSIVLLTGGEPFIRNDIAEIAEACMVNGVHPRLQTNGLASNDQLDRVAALGAHDISISLDSLEPSIQDGINGDVEDSWRTAIDRIAYINRTFPEDSFCALGCVLAPSNIDEVIPLIHFANAIGWWVSLVPAHQSAPTEPRSFATFDQSMVFNTDEQRRAAAVLDQVRSMKHDGFNLYDSDEYLDDIERYITGSNIRWRRRNDEQCDSPNLYFAIQPNGDMAVCCDYRIATSYPVHDPRFPEWYRNREMFPEINAATSACSGCMYGSYPEITISARYARPMFERAQLFLKGGPKRRLVPMSTDEMVELAAQIRAEHLVKA